MRRTVALDDVGVGLYLSRLVQCRLTMAAMGEMCHGQMDEFGWYMIEITEEFGLFDTMMKGFQIFI
jgi:hypothetical protein